MTKTNTEVQTALNNLVAAHSVFTTKLYQHHFYVQGSHFFTLHEKFEELYNETTEKFDELAERLLAIGGKPYSTLQEFLDHSSIKEKPYTGKVSAMDMVTSIVMDFRIMRDELAKAITLTGEAGDNVTQDVLIGYKTAVDKHIWMLQAFLGKDPLEGE
ncbi:Dps family protein [Carnobacterium funditum]|uniref:Dps family protein n=1 Tax=Carnobacterium funditum TaxID=2752 RepID=UPI000557E635|nr:DNA starvation/stationary phase protection protein [Carnobacterium funditum]